MLSPQARMPRLQAISEWSVVAHDRILGVLHDDQGTSTGKRVITSPVVQVVFSGVDQVPVAVTRSGSTYWLGEPAAAFGDAKARFFVEAKSPPLQFAPADLDSERTVIYQLQG